MSFTSAAFLFIFLPVVLIGYGILLKTRKIKWTNFFLTAVSLMFYAWGGIGFLVLLLVSAGINFFLGRALEGPHKKVALWTAVIYNLGVLVFFKYTKFLISNIGLVFGIESIEWNDSWGMPLGISFFTFQILSYVFDVYRGRVKAQQKFGNLLLYIVLFPKVISGPIVRYADIENALFERVVSLDDVTNGTVRFMRGFCKKIFLANKIGEIADAVFALEGSINTGFAWMGIICYALQIFMDSSSYADMAIGLGQIFGFSFTENFNYPYISKSIKEFWRRWHISLSSWFRDYVYIPLGGSRKGNFATYRNLIVVFFLTGLWHGASWNFVFWGLFYGVFLIAERVGLDKILKKFPDFVQRIYTLLIVLVGWVFFRAESMGKAVSYIHSMFSFNFIDYKVLTVLKLIDLEHILFFIIAIFASTPVFKILGEKVKNENVIAIKNVAWGVMFFIAACYMMGSEFNPFIYFKF